MRVQGFCPVCGGSLFLGEGGYVTCSRIECPEPDAASTILGDREVEHVVVFRDDDFTIRHPLRERLRDELLDCELHAEIRKYTGPPVYPGTYRAIRANDGFWSFDEIREGLPS